MKPSKAVPTIAATVMLAASASGDPAAILLFTAAGCASAPRAADTARASKGDGLESERALPIPADLVRPVEQAARLGRLIYQVDKASAIGTDVLRARVPDYRSRRVAGWLTLEEGDAGGDGPAFSVLFYNDENPPRFVFNIRVPRAGEPTLQEYAPPEALNDEMMRLFRARRNALAVAPTGRRRMNPVILPLSTAGQPDSILVYLLAAEMVPGQMVFGVHYRVLASEDGFTIKELTPLSKSALVVDEKLPADVPRGAKLVAHVVSHLVTDWPLETHVFVSLLHKNVPIYVVTRRGTWLVIGDKITLVDDKPPVPR
ncbi:MAG TPA: hypothetical protein VN903_31760 [Polyangia bacterium]|jgi:hypothetical protein|nr:hypothetical protein [Polyangia bacterium]